MYQEHNSTHYVAYQRLRESCRELYQAYIAFHDSNHEVAPEFLYDDYSLWLSNLRAPIRSNTGNRIKAIRDSCTALIGELIQSIIVLQNVAESLAIVTKGGDDIYDSEELSSLPLQGEETLPCEILDGLGIGWCSSGRTCPQTFVSRD